LERNLTCEAVQDGDLVARYVTDRLDPDALEEFEAHMLTCDRCQDEVRLALALQEELPAQVGDASVLAGAARRPRRLPLAAVGTGLAAAAALLLVLVLPRSANLPTGLPDHRAPSGIETPAELAPVPLAPVGAVERVSDLIWSRVDGANRYRVTLLDEGGNVVWESETPDTTIAIPPAQSLASGTTYFWKVDARFGFERWLASDVAEFRLLPEGAVDGPPDGPPD
jgi:hypothetical protein